MNRAVRILNGSFDALTLRDAVDQIFARIEGNASSWVSTVNVSTLMRMRREPELQSMVDQSAIVVADGQPLVWYSWLTRRPLPERVTGIDLVAALCERAAQTGKTVYLLGSTPVLLMRAIAKLKAGYPGLRIEGSDGYFSPAEAHGRVNAIRESGADLLLVGMGSPKQDEFIRHFAERSGAKIAMGVGGSFDVIAGVRWRAPQPLRHAGLEWFVRMLQEPRRLAPRYLRSNTQFCMLIAGDLIWRIGGGRNKQPNTRGRDAP